MKKINIAYINNDQNIELTTKFIKFILTKSNKLIKITDEINDNKIKNIIKNKESINCIFVNQFLLPEKMQIIFKKFNLESFYQQIDFFVDDVYDDLALLSLEPYDKENSNKIKDILVNNCIIFDYHPPKNLIYFFAKIFFDILTKHKLINGNKRVAVLLLYKLCYNYGFFVENQLSKDSHEYWQINENKIIKFIEHYQETHSSEKVQEEIYQWLVDNLYIANNWKEY